MNIRRYETKSHFPGRYGWVPDMWVLHNTSTAGIRSPHHTFINSQNQVSAHFLIGTDGETRQYVDIRDGAWCNGTSTNPKKHSYYGNSLSQYIRDRETNANYYTLSIEFVGATRAPLTLSQEEAAVELITEVNKDLKKIYGKGVPVDREHIIGHYQVNPRNKGTCGVGIDYDNLIRLLQVEQTSARIFQET